MPRVKEDKVVLMVNKYNAMKMYRALN